MKINVIHPINQLKKSQIIISIDTEKVFNKNVKYLFTIATLRKQGIEGTFLNLIKTSTKVLQLTYLVVKD